MPTLLVGTTIAIVAHAGLLELDHSTDSWTGVSGATNEGEDSTLETQDKKPEGYAVTGFYMAEDADKPVYMRVEFSKPSSDGSGSEASSYLYVDEGRSWNSSSGKSVSLGRDNFVTAVRVCTNGESDGEKVRIKGLELWGRSLKTDGSFGPEVRAKFERANCRKWVNKAGCPNGKIATGVRAYFSSNGFSGIKLRCTAIDR